MMTGPALAECLDLSSLDEGVLVTLSDGSELAVTRRTDALLQLDLDDPMSGRYLAQAWHGVFVESFEFVAADGNQMRSETKFLLTPPMPKAGDNGKLPIWEFGGPATLAYRVSELAQFELGDCRYDFLMVVQDRPAMLGTRSFFGSLYFPDLGLGFAGEPEDIVALELLP
jgi:hypothetical protein